MPDCWDGSGSGSIRLGAAVGEKNMCSYRCDRPFSSGDSVNDPLRTARSSVTIGTEWSSSTITCSPFFNVWLASGSDRWGWEACAVGFPGAGVCASGLTAASASTDTTDMNTASRRGWVTGQA